MKDDDKIPWERPKVEARYAILSLSVGAANVDTARVRLPGDLKGERGADLHSNRRWNLPGSRRVASRGSAAMGARCHSAGARQAIRDSMMYHTTVACEST